MIPNRPSLIRGPEANGKEESMMIRSPARGVIGCMTDPFRSSEAGLLGIIARAVIMRTMSINMNVGILKGAEAEGRTSLNTRAASKGTIMKGRGYANTRKMIIGGMITSRTLNELLITDPLRENIHLVPEALVEDPILESKIGTILCIRKDPVSQRDLP